MREVIKTKSNPHPFPDTTASCDCVHSPDPCLENMIVIGN